METLLVTAVTVLKVMVAACTGSIFAFALPEQSVRDLNFLNGNLLSPCFSFANLVNTLSWQLVQTSWVIFVFAGVAIATSQLVGFGCAALCCSSSWLSQEDELRADADADAESVVQLLRRKLKSAFTTPSPRDYAPLYQVILGTQNTGNFPIAVLASLVGGGVDWYDSAALLKSLPLIFVYTSIWNLPMWSISLWALRRGARQRKIARAAAVSTHRASMRTEASRHISSIDDLGEGVVNERSPDSSATTSILPPDWLTLNESITEITLTGSAPASSLAGGLSTAAAGSETAACSKPKHLQFAQRISKLNLPIVATISGIACALVPGLPAVVSLPPCQIIIGGLTLIGDACVPLTLFTLGANLTIGGAGPLKRIDGRFVLVGTFAKTILNPAINVAIYFFLDWLGWLPADKILRITAFTELIAPSAVMSATLFKLEEYMAECATGLLLVQYVVATITTTGWLSFFLMHV